MLFELEVEGGFAVLPAAPGGQELLGGFPYAFALLGPVENGDVDGEGKSMHLLQRGAVLVHVTDLEVGVVLLAGQVDRQLAALDELFFPVQAGVVLPRQLVEGVERVRQLSRLDSGGGRQGGFRVAVEQGVEAGLGGFLLLLQHRQPLQQPRELDLGAQHVLLDAAAHLVAHLGNVGQLFQQILVLLRDLDGFLVIEIVVVSHLHLRSDAPAGVFILPPGGFRFAVGHLPAQLEFAREGELLAGGDQAEAGRVLAHHAERTDVAHPAHPELGVGQRLCLRHPPAQGLHLAQLALHSRVVLQRFLNQLVQHQPAAAFLRRGSGFPLRDNLSRDFAGRGALLGRQTGGEQAAQQSGYTYNLLLSTSPHDNLSRQDGVATRTPRVLTGKAGTRERFERGLDQEDAVQGMKRGDERARRGSVDLRGSGTLLLRHAFKARHISQRDPESLRTQGGNGLRGRVAGGHLTATWVGWLGLGRPGLGGLFGQGAPARAGGAERNSLPADGGCEQRLGYKHYRHYQDRQLCRSFQVNPLP